MVVIWSEFDYGFICLDLCCGSGDLVYMLVKYVGNIGYVFGVDFFWE